MIAKRRLFAHRNVINAECGSAFRVASYLQSELTRLAFDFSVRPERPMPWNEVRAAFEAKNSKLWETSEADFRAFVKDLCLQIAAASPLYVSREEVPAADLQKERDIAAAQVQGKPPAAVQKIVEGKLDKYYSTICLLDQPFVKLPEKTVKDMVTERIAKIGENIQVRRFVRYQLGS